jgi:(E)-4-hydroxy-3-methylbut-2-enyl-diphosphate synthase
MIRANEAVASVCNYPIHLGVTEAGTANMGSIKSAVGIGSLLTHGIGDTLRVSLTDDPVLEPKKGREILASLGMDERSKIDLVSCPTCGRTKVGLFELANEFESRMNEMHPSRHLKVAIMGCAVNGPGEASDADIGIAGGDNEVLMFKGGRPVGKLSMKEAIGRLIEEINQM